MSPCPSGSTSNVHADIAAAAPADAILCTSTSGLPTKIQEGLERPDDLIVARPFNPVYLLPLVELARGRGRLRA